MLNSSNGLYSCSNYWFLYIWMRCVYFRRVKSFSNLSKCQNKSSVKINNAPTFKLHFMTFAYIETHAILRNGSQRSNWTKYARLYTQCPGKKESLAISVGVPFSRTQCIFILTHAYNIFNRMRFYSCFKIIKKTYWDKSDANRCFFRILTACVDFFLVILIRA